MNKEYIKIRPETIMVTNEHVPSDEEFARETNDILNEEYKNNVWTKRLRKRNILG